MKFELILSLTLKCSVTICKVIKQSFFIRHKSVTLPKQAQVYPRATTYPSFYGIMQLGVLPLPPPPEWDAIPSQHYHPAFHQASLTIPHYPFLLLDGEGHGESKVFCPRT